MLSKYHVKILQDQELFISLKKIFNRKIVQTDRFDKIW